MRNVVLVEWYADGQRRFWRWTGSPAVIGSADGCALRLVHSEVADRHLRIRRTGHRRVRLEWLVAEQDGRRYRIASVETHHLPTVALVGPYALRIGGRPVRYHLPLALLAALAALPFVRDAPERGPVVARRDTVPLPALEPEALVRWAAEQERAAAFEPGALGRAWAAWCALRTAPGVATQAQQRCDELQHRWQDRRRSLLRQVFRAAGRHDEVAAQVVLERLRREAEPFGESIFESWPQLTRFIERDATR